MGHARAAGPVAKKRIGDLMVEAGLITPAMLSEALAAQKERGTKLVDTLIHLGHITVDEFVNFLSRQPGIASLDLRRYHIQREVVALITREVAERLEVFPVDRMGRLLTLAMACPLDAKTIGEIETSTGLRVKPILCPAADIRAAIDSYYGNQAALKHAEAEAVAESAAVAAPGPPQEPAPLVAAKARTGIRLNQIVDQVRRLTSLPALPQTVSRVQEALGDITISPKEVAQTIARDPAIAIKVLSVANSPAFGFASQVETIELAVALLGLRETYSIVLSAAVLNVFETKKRFDYSRFREEAMNTAGAARVIAKHANKNKDGSAFTAGLLHDIGRIALLEIVPDLYVQLPPKLSGADLVAAEEKILGLAHPEAGYELAVHWHLPNALALAIRHHHHPAQAPECKQEAAVVALAEAWTRDAQLVGRGKKDLLQDTGLLQTLAGLDTRVAEAAFDQVRELPRAEFSWEPAPAARTKKATV